MFTISCRIFAIIQPRLLNSLGSAEAQHFHLTVVQQRSGKSDEKKCSQLNKIIQWNSKKNFIFNGTKKYSPSQLLYLLYLFSFLSLLFFPPKKPNKISSIHFYTLLSTKKQTSQVLFSNTYPHVSCTKLTIINVFSTYNPFFLWYFVTKIDLIYCEKKLFQSPRKTFEIRG